MPIFEAECETDGRFEALKSRLPDEEYLTCPVCGIPAPLVPSLPVMKPDNMWAGQKTSYGYFTAASQFRAAMKQRNHVVCGDRTDRESMDKVAERAAVAKEEKTKKDIRGVMERAFGPSGLGLGGADGTKLLNDVTKTN